MSIHNMACLVMAVHPISIEMFLSKLEKSSQKSEPNFVPISIVDDEIFQWISENFELLVLDEKSCGKCVSCKSIQHLLRYFSLHKSGELTNYRATLLARPKCLRTTDLMSCNPDGIGSVEIAVECIRLNIK